MLNADLQASLDQFRTRALPALLRKFQVWQGLNESQQQELAEESTQELWLDCLTHPERLRQLDHAGRCSRWFRLLENRHYHLYTKTQRRASTPSPDDEPLAPEDHGVSEPDLSARMRSLDLPRAQRQLAEELLSKGQFLANGRLNCRVSARRLGMSSHTLARRWELLSAELGFGPEFLGFWRRRLVEALLGLASDLLRDSGKLHLCAEQQRRRPDPRGRMRRILGIRRWLDCRPLPSPLRNLLSRYRRIAQGLAQPPLSILADVRSLSPEDPRCELWSVEAALASGQLDAAYRYLRAARRCGADPIACALAQARLHQLRCGTETARQFLLRTRQRFGAEPRLGAALRSVQSSRAAAIRSASSASTTGSPTTGVQLACSPLRTCR